MASPRLRATLILGLLAAALVVAAPFGLAPVPTALGDANEAPSPGNANQARLSAGYYHACLVTTPSGQVQCWGANTFGSLGDGTTTQRTSPVYVKNADGSLLSNVTAITTGMYHTCALTSTQEVKCWGYNASGRLGDGTTDHSSFPVAVKNSDGSSLGSVIAISAGESHTCALTTSPRVVCWGTNDYGALGNNSTTSASTPVEVHTSASDTTPLTGVTAISTGKLFSCALTATTSVKCWGRNNERQLGDGTRVDSLTPVDVKTSAEINAPPLTGVTAISSGGAHTCVLTSDQTAKCWGYGTSKQLGNYGSSSAIPVDVKTSPSDPNPLGGLTAISAGGAHTCALTSSNEVRCWGWNHFGQLGDDQATTTGGEPVLDTGESQGGQALPSVVAVTGGYHSNCALMPLEAVKCWGHNGNGQLGNGTYTGSATPVDVNPPADTTPPTVTITRAGSGSLVAGDTDTITFTLSETATDFDASDVTVSANATLSSFSGSGTTYTATVTPDPNTTGTITIDIASGTFTDAASNPNTAATQFTIPFDTTPPTTTTTTTTTTTPPTTTTRPPSPPAAPSPGSSSSTSSTTSTTPPGSSSTSPSAPPPAPPVAPPSTVPFGGAIAVTNGKADVIVSATPTVQRGRAFITITHSDGRVLTMEHELVTGVDLEVRRTDLMTITGQSYPASTTVEIWMHSTPTRVATTTTDTTGNFAVSFAVPPQLDDGLHILQVVSGAAPAYASTAIAIRILPIEPIFGTPTPPSLPITGRDPNLVMWALAVSLAGAIALARSRCRPT